MPLYEYQCSSCEVIYETMETMAENAERPTPHCPACDPEFEKPTTMYKYLGNCKPMVTLKGAPGRGWTPGSF
jgi:putative FmdB family regulatory protein